MNCRKYSPLLILMLFSLVACAQKTYGIKNIQLFSRVHIPGNIPVNEKGEPLMGPDTLYTIVAETTGKPVQWTIAYTKEKAYSITATPINNQPYDAGINTATGKRMLVASAKGNQLWLLELSPIAESNNARLAVSKPTIMLLKGQSGKTAFTYSIQKIIAIETTPVY